MQKKSYLLAILALSSILLTSCGGGGGGSTGGGSVNIPKPSILWKFDDFHNYGVVRATVSVPQQNNAIFHYITLSVDEFVEDFNSTGSDTDTPDTSGTSLDEKLEHGELHRGVIRFTGFSLNGIAYQDDYPNLDIALAYIGNENATITFAGATQLSNIPTGSFQYNGFIAMAPRNYFSANRFEHGKFTMNVNFDDATGDIDGTFGGNRRLEGDFNINETNGSFRGNNLELTLGFGTEVASIYGNFHGNGAAGVTGVFHGETSNSGMLAGARVDLR